MQEAGAALQVQAQAGPAAAVKAAGSPGGHHAEHGSVAAASRHGSLRGSPSSSLASRAGECVRHETSHPMAHWKETASLARDKVPQRLHHGHGAGVGCAGPDSMTGSDAQQPIRAALRDQMGAAGAHAAGAASMHAQEPRLENLLDAPHSWMPRLEVTRLMLGRCVTDENHTAPPQCEDDAGTASDGKLCVCTGAA